MDSFVRVYGSREKTFDHNGYALLEPIEGTLTHELDGRYEVSAVFERSEKTDYLRRNAVIKVPMYYHGEPKPQLMRIYKPVKEMDTDGVQRVAVDARAVFYDLGGRLLEDCRPTNMNGKAALDHIFGSIKGGIPAYNLQFSYNSNISDLRTAYYQNKSVVQALLGADNSFVKRWGGHLYRDNLYFSLNRAMENSRSTGMIRYGSNMQSVTYTENVSDCITWLIAEDNFGSKYEIHDSSVPNADFPFHIYKYVKFTYDTEDIKQFHRDAQAYFDTFSQPQVNIKVKFADIYGKSEYADFFKLADYEVGDRVIIYHKDLGISYGNLMIIAKTYNIVTHETIDIEIGAFKDALIRKGG